MTRSSAESSSGLARHNSVLLNPWMCDRRVLFRRTSGDGPEFGDIKERLIAGHKTCDAACMSEKRYGTEVFETVMRRGNEGEGRTEVLWEKQDFRNIITRAEKRESSHADDTIDGLNCAFN